jgi:DNA-binding NarL/FixJ family response regulator
MSSLAAARIILVDDHQIVLDSLSMLLSTFEQINVVGAYTSGRSALNYYRDFGAELIITDMNMPDMSGVQLCGEAKKINPDCRVLMLTMVEDARIIRDAVRVGVDGYLLKIADGEELVTAIQTVLLGQKYFSDEVIVELAISRDETISSRPGTFARLTIRELEVLRLIGREMSTSEIAEQLFISVATVETHRRNLLQKIGAKSVVGLVLFAVKNDLLD